MQASLTAGVTQNVPETVRGKLSVYYGDVRFVGEFLLGEGVQFAFLGGNSPGDITDVEGHAAFITSLAATLAPAVCWSLTMWATDTTPARRMGPPSGRRPITVMPGHRGH